MYTRDSRYRHVEDVTRVDAAGRELVVTDLRRRPSLTGTFHHVVEGGDRLDHLAHHYYRRSRQWWRISDANPDVLSPLRLIGDDPLATVRLVVPAEPPPAAPWSTAVRTLAARTGVDHVAFALEERRAGPATIPVGVLTVWFNTLTVTAEDLAAGLEGAGFGPGPREDVGRVGKPIVVPPPGLA